MRQSGYRSPAVAMGTHIDGRDVDKSNNDINHILLDYSRVLCLYKGNNPNYILLISLPLYLLESEDKCSQADLLDMGLYNLIF